MKLALVVLSAGLALTACGSRQRLEWAGGTGDLQQALSQCDYEVAMGTQFRDQSWGAAAGIEQRLRREDLAQRCMRAKGGWSLRPVSATESSAPVVTWSAPDFGKVGEEGRAASAKRLAISGGCESPNMRPLGIVRTMDTYEASCKNRSDMTIKCMTGNSQCLVVN